MKERGGRMFRINGGNEECGRGRGLMEGGRETIKHWGLLNKGFRDGHWSYMETEIMFPNTVMI